MLLIVPVVIILVAKNLGHIKAVTAMTGKNLDQYMGRAFIGDGVATMVSGAAGGTGVTTYAENIGVMAATRIYSTAVFMVAAIWRCSWAFSQVWRTDFSAIPLPVMGGVSIVVFGLIAIAGAKNLGGSTRSLSDTKNLDRGGHHPDFGHWRIHAEVWRIRPGWHWLRHVWRHLAVRTAEPRQDALNASGAPHAAPCGGCAPPTCMQVSFFAQSCCTAAFPRTSHCAMK